MTQPHPPGWYPDPQRVEIQRYWDGEKWTDQTQSKKPSNPKNVKYLLAIVVIVIVVIVVASIAGGNDDKSETASDVSNVPVQTVTTPNASEQAAIASAAEAAAETSRAAEKAAAAAAAARRAALLDKSSYQAVDSRQWQLVAKRPDSHTGEKYVVYGRVVQADSATGDDIRVNTDGQQVDYYDMDINTVASEGQPGIFGNIVEDDLVTMWVVVTGSTSYDTTMGGSVTAPTVDVNMIEPYGSTG
ncbi:DUF2510 domain-containing protein [Gordonia insulae]|uniref:DUF2510 domain-containing protein n=1 Tax=Gordonia insulae TaxID=2420509 RepID=A0A3G8JEH6_9ACTN|nr:DUF2510 domain-containing protein [Gordonia insulae]AZG43487.1 hypothetical protein D7316_00052 [Gordonia insulae]